MTMQRVFFDPNAGTHDAGYLLWFPTSLDELSKITEPLRDGLQVVIHDDEELEYVAELLHDAELNHWRAIPIRDAKVTRI